MLSRAPARRVPIGSPPEAAQLTKLYHGKLGLRGNLFLPRQAGLYRCSPRLRRLGSTGASCAKPPQRALRAAHAKRAGICARRRGKLARTVRPSPATDVAERDVQPRCADHNLLASQRRHKHNKFDVSLICARQGSQVRPPHAIARKRGTKRICHCPLWPHTQTRTCAACHLWAGWWAITPRDLKRCKRDNVIQHVQPPRTQLNLANVKCATRDRVQTSREPPAELTRAGRPSTRLYISRCRSSG